MLSKVLRLGGVVLLLSGCVLDWSPTPTAPIEYDLSGVEPTAAIRVSPTPQATLPCRVENLFPSIAILMVDTATMAIDFGQFDLELPQSPSFSAPAWSPNGMQAVVSIQGIVNEGYQTGVALLNIESKKGKWLLSYPSLKGWRFADPLWSPNGDWIAYIPKDAAYAEDVDLRVFSADSEDSHQFSAQY